MDLWKKFLAFGSKPSYATFPDLPKAIIWVRFMVAVLYGSYLGLAQIRGGANVVLGANVIVFIPVLYCQLILVESYPNLTFAGVPNAVSIMLLIWIFFYTMSFAEQEAQLAAAINVAMAAVKGDEPMDGTAATGGDETATTTTTTAIPVEPTPVVVAEDSEF